jgi:TonB-linked SusC/RagA family outer membrane protein
MGAPLVLVDGFERDINDLSVEEIESVTLLKDAASLALYGMRGINGVLIVTTKRGMYSPMEIDFSYDHAVKFAQSTIPMANAFTYASALNEAYANDGLSAQYNQYQLDAFRDGSMPNVYADVNWADEILKDVAHSNSYNIQVRGGGKNVRYYSAAAYDTDKGFVGLDAPESSIPNQFQYSNLNVRSNLDVTLTKNTLLTLNLLGKLQESSRPRLSSGDLMSSIYNTPAAAFPIKTESGEWGASTIWKKNPVADLMTAGFTKYHTRTLFANMGIDQNLDAITKGLKASARIAFDSDALISEYKSKAYRTQTITPVFDEIGNPIDIQYNTVGVNNGSYGFSSGLSSQWRKMTAQGILDYQTSFNKSKIGLGYIFELSNTTGKGQHKTYKRVNNSFYASYAYDKRYLLDASFSVAASNVLNPRRKWGYFPAVSAAWMISEESFVKNSKVIDYLKLHASWGILGSDNMGFDLYKQEYTGGSYVNFGNFIGSPTLKMNGLPTSNLTYIKSRNINFGIEGTFFEGLDLSLDLFHNRKYDMIISNSHISSSVLGVGSGYSNDAEYTYKGIELGLGYSGSQGDLKYSAMGHFTFTRSKVVNINEQYWKNDFNKATGRSVGQMFGFESIGFFADQAEIDNSPTQTFSEVQAGDIKYKDQDANGIIDQYDRVAIGKNSFMPEMYFSFDLNVEYRNLGMNLLFQGVGNYSRLMTSPSIYRPLVGNTNISQHYYDNRWTPTNQDARFPRLTTETNENNTQSSTTWLQDLSYLKLRSAEIYYTLPAQVVSKVNLNSAKLFVRGYNLFSLDKMDVGDPETSGSNYPLYRSVNVGVKLGF